MSRLPAFSSAHRRRGRVGKMRADALTHDGVHAVGGRDIGWWNTEGINRDVRTLGQYVAAFDTPGQVRFSYDPANLIGYSRLAPPRNSSQASTVARLDMGSGDATSYFQMAADQFRVMEGAVEGACGFSRQGGVLGAAESQFVQFPFGMAAAPNSVILTDIQVTNCTPSVANIDYAGFELILTPSANGLFAYKGRYKTSTNPDGGPPPGGGDCGRTGPAIAAGECFRTGLSKAQAITAVAIAGAESGWDRFAENPPCCYGPWQINIIAHPMYTKAYVETWDGAGTAMAAISSGGTDFTPWSTFNSGAYLRFINQATPAVNCVYASPGSLGAAVWAEAQNKLGDPYVFGANGPNAFDCSGLTQWCYKIASGGTIFLIHHAATQFKTTHRICTGACFASAAQGDLVFFRYGNNCPPDCPGHVAIAQGDGTHLISATNPSTGVQYTTIGALGGGGTVMGVTRP